MKLARERRAGPVIISLYSFYSLIWTWNSDLHPVCIQILKTPKGKGSIQDDDTLTGIRKPERVENGDAPYILSPKNDYVFRYLDGKEGKGPSGFFK